jgi:hypothetical protein
MSQPKILISILSCHKERHLHQQVRNTWMKNNPGVDVKFFLGLPKLADTADEVFLDVPDDFEHVSDKVVASIEWAYTRGYDFKFKCDNDTYVHIPRLLTSGFEKYDYSGLRYPYSDLPTIFNINERSEAYGGSGYWLNRSTMKIVLDNRNSPQYRGAMEDHWIGAILRRFAVSNHNDKRYHDSLDGPAPENDYISCHNNHYGDRTDLWETSGALRDYATLLKTHKRASRIGMTPIKVLIAVHGWITGAANGEHQAMRDTFLKDCAKYPGLEYKFFIGDGTPTGENDSVLWNSFRSYENEYKVKAETSLASFSGKTFSYSPLSDEIVLATPDDYLHTSYKTKLSLKWAIEQGFDYVFGCPTDTYISLSKLMHSGFEQYDYSGMQCGGYAAGGPGCWLSRKVAQLVVDEPTVTDWPEDRWIGEVMRKHGIACHYDSRYAEMPAQPHRNNDIITSHLAHTPTKYVPSLMYDAHRSSEISTTVYAPPVTRGLPVRFRAVYRYANDTCTTNWWDRNRR